MNIFQRRLTQVLASTMAASIAGVAVAAGGGMAGKSSNASQPELRKIEGDGDLNNRVDALEKKMDKILELLQKNSERTPAKIDKQTSDTDNAQKDETPSALQSGLTLNLFLLGGVMKPRPFNSGKTFNLRPIPIEDGMPVATAKIRVPKAFAWDAFTEIPAMSRYESMTSQRDTDKQVALQWRGMLQAPETGDYQYLVSIEVGGNSGSSACVGLMQLDDQKVVRVESRKSTPGYGDYKERYGADQGQVSLAAGVHKFSFWAYCTGESNIGVNHSAVKFDIQQKAPSDDSPRPLDTNSLFVEN